MTRDRYLPYGGNRNATGTTTMPTDRGWQGQTQDKDTGLDYLDARYYDPVLAHFISVDELTDNDQTAAANPYGYAAANPILFNDPTGLWPGEGLYKKAATFAADHPTLTNIAVGVAVGAFVVGTGGIGGAIVAGAVAGAAGGAVGYGAKVASGRESFSAKNLAKSVAGGAVEGAIGGATGGIGGKAAAFVAKRVIKPGIKAATNAGGKVVAGTARASRSVATKASNAGKAAIAKGKTVAGNLAVKVRPTGMTALKRAASEIREAGLHPAARNQRVIAVGVGRGRQIYAGSSNGFDAGQRAALARLGIKRVPGSGRLHAEEELLRAVPRLRRVATSRLAPCGPAKHNCAAQLKARGVKVGAKR